ncbi:hypothetical protein P0D73_19815 [Paraburkholderia sp. RL18-101-BIB-B]|uniref:hypothetical protein n=1 Tax=Paraburkholderia sp. RL18-101-BIB-B TaxID=3031634 RepID=UPI0038BC976D
MKEATLNDYLKLVKGLWRFSHRMPFGLRIEPWVGRSTAQVAHLKTHGARNQVLPYTLDEFAGFIRIALTDIEKVDEVCTLFRSRTRWDVRLAAAARLRTAASVIMFALEGMRPEEIYRLPYDCLRKGTLTTEDGVVDVVWLCGRIYKDKPPGGVAHRWLAADEVVKAVLALKKLWRTLENALQKPTEEGGIPEKTAPAIESARGFLFPKLRLAAGNTGLATKTGLAALKLYASSSEFTEANIRPSAVTHKRFRPTLARAFARLKLGDVRYFMSHFGHEQWKTTEGYFLTFADDELQGDVDRQVKSEGQAIIDTILSSPVPLLGGRGEQLEVHRRSYPVMTFKDRKDLVRTMERGYKIRLGPQALCMVEKNGEFCPPDCLYEEERCLHCHKGVVGYGHVEVWQDMYARGTAFLDEVPPESPAATVTRANLREIKTTILTLGGEVAR